MLLIGEYIETFIVCTIIIVLTIVFVILNTVRYATIQIDNIQFEVELDNAILNDEVVIFYSKDDKGQMIYRFTIKKETQKC